VDLVAKRDLEPAPVPPVDASGTRIIASGNVDPDLMRQAMESLRDRRGVIVTDEKEDVASTLTNIRGRS
jgi:hypothetical protein